MTMRQYRGLFQNSIRRNHHHAVVLHKVDGSFKDRNIESQSPQAGQVKVRVDACSIAYRDTLDRAGAFPFIQFPAVLGHEVAGTVQEIGNDVSEYKPGDRVVSVHWAQDDAWPSPLSKKGPTDSFLGLNTHGGYQREMIVKPSSLVKIPDSIAKQWTPVHASTVMSTWGTVWMGAVVRAGLKPGNTVLITGASGGVGSAAVQLCKHLQCRVIAVTSCQAKATYLRNLGADEVIVGIKEMHKHSSIGDGVEMVLECTGEPSFEIAIRCMAPEGSMVLVGNTTNAIGKLPLGLAILKSLKIVGSDSISRKALLEVFEFMTKNNLRPSIHSVIPLTAQSIEDAHHQICAKNVTGRIVANVSHESWN